MKDNLKVSGIVIFGLLLSFTLPNIINMSTTKSFKEKKQTTVKKEKVTKNDSLVMADKNEKKDTAVPAPAEPEVKEEKVEEKEEKIEEPVVEEKEEVITTEAPVLTIAYDDMTTEDLINAINIGSYKLQYSSPYEASTTNRFSKARGAIYYGDHKETYYSERVLPGTSLNIPGRHVAEDGTVRDGEGYICVAASTAYLPRGSVVKTSMGPAKVYDSGCAPGIIDIYTNW